MKYLLDTDHISFLQRKSGQEYQNIIRHIRQHSSRDFAFSIISFAHTFIVRSQNSDKLLKGYRLLHATGN